MFSASFPGANYPAVSKFNMVRLTTTQKWTAPMGVTRARVIVTDGGQGGFNNTGGDGSPLVAGKGGDTAIADIDLIPGEEYTATIGAGTAAGTAAAPGGASSFAGQDLSLTTANVVSTHSGILIKGSGSPNPGGTPSDNQPAGGGTYLGGFGQASAGNNGVGGDGGRNDDSGSGTAGADGAVIIFY